MINMELPESLKNRITAGEIVTSGVCPLHCEYCYIPKHSSMKEMHKKIEEDIKSNKIFDTIEKFYGKDIEHLGFWGTEPYLTLPLLQTKIEYILDRFPKLCTTNLSTSGLLDQQILIDYIAELERICKLKDRKYSMDVQISVDGPPWITDKNRQEGASDAVPKALFKLIELLNKCKLDNVKVDIRFKSTISIDNMREFNKQINLIDDYFKYFSIMDDMFAKESKNTNVKLQDGGGTPSIVVPGKYTVQDGKDFAQYLYNLKRLGYESSYEQRFHRSFNMNYDISDRRITTCSGANSNFGISGNNIMLCHRSFFYDNKEYVDSILKDNNIENWDVSLFESGSLKNIQKYFIVDSIDTNALIRFIYAARSYHDFWKMQNSYIRAMVMEMARSSQAEERFLHDSAYVELFSIFMNTATSCPMENLLNTGSLQTIPISLIRFFGNGAFASIIDGFEKKYGIYANELINREK